jgi:uncharacterized protein (DUF1501 family)
MAEPLHRRAFLQLGAAGLLGLLWDRGLFERRAFAARPRAPADAAILIWLNGGPSHLDTFDPKPGGKVRPVATRAPGLTLAAELPHLGELADRLALVRSLTSREGNHDRARLLAHTGYVPNPTVAYPSLGGWVSAELGGELGDLPAFVSIAGPSVGAGFLGISHGPFVVADPRKPPANTSYPRGVDFDRFARRRTALAALEDDFARQSGDAMVESRRAVYAQSVRMMYSPRLSAFDLGEEPESVARAYGDNDFGRGCLLARRLVEAGVRFVEVWLDGWDTHKDNFNRTARLCEKLDPALATLLSELGARDRLARTIVLCMGEFGRTPRINADEGRDHHPQAFSALLAGGGLRGGVVVGATSEDGERVVDRPLSPADLLATVASALGLDPAQKRRAPGGRPVALSDGGVPIRELAAG